MKRRQLEEEEMIGMEKRPVTYASVRGNMTWMDGDQHGGHRWINRLAMMDGSSTTAPG